ncbi:MAG: DNA polymerase III subunit delta' [Planctomycetaceae bacterium]
MFRRAVQRGRTAHAYLFLGPAGVGKRLFAEHVAQALFCGRCDDTELDACGSCSGCKQVLSGTHPDLLTVGLPDGKRELPIEAFVGSEDRRGREGLLKELSLRPMTATRRIAIIDDADRMNEASANALLKTLEEPPPNSILILISPSSDALLPTIRSRCQPLLFSALSEQDVAELIVQLDWDRDPAVAAVIARLSEGSLDTARQLMDPGLRALREMVSEMFSSHPFAPIEGSQCLLKGLEELGGGSAGQRENAGWWLRFAIDFLRQSLAPIEDVSPAMQKFRRRHPTEDPDAADRIAGALDRCLMATRQLHQSMPVPLCLESLLHDVSCLLRGVLVMT